MLKSKQNTLAVLLDPSINDDAELAEVLFKVAEKARFGEFEKYLQDNPPSPQLIYYLMVKAQKGLQYERAKKGGKGKAAKLKEPKEKIRQAWAGGNYRNRDICAEEEYSSLGFDSFKTARNALKLTPNPDPWPAKKKK